MYNSRADDPTRFSREDMKQLFLSVKEGCVSFQSCSLVPHLLILIVIFDGERLSDCYIFEILRSDMVVNFDQDLSYLIECRFRTF